MSTIKVNSIKNTATNDGGIAIDNSGHVQIDGQQLPSAGALSNRNLIINGAMQVDQRGTTTGVSTTGYYAVDRMRISQNSIATARYTREQSTDAPDGFASSLKVTTTTAEGSVGAADGYRPLHYKIEGQDLQQLQYGTSGAKSLTLSFYVKSSVTGTYCVSFNRLETQNRIITATYAISSANTWEYKTITISGDTSSSITNDNANRFEIYWIGGSGTDDTATDTSGSWTNYVSTGFAFGHSSSVQLQNTLNSTWQITGVQLEVGEKATPFEHEPHSVTLAKCQRYYFRVDGNDADGICHGYAQDSNTLQSLIQFPNSMRAAPTSLEQTGTASDYSIGDRGSDHTCTTAPTFISATKNAARFFVSSTGNLSAGDMGQVRFNAAGKFLAFPAEL